MTHQRSFSLDIIMKMTKQGFKDVFFVLAPILRVYMKITPDMKTMMNMWHADKDDDNNVFCRTPSRSDHEVRLSSPPPTHHPPTHDT